MKDNENETRETIADIVAEMKRTKYGDEDCSVKWCLHKWADRLEAAAKRENAQSGNAAAMREALSDACYAMFNFLKTQSGGYEEMANALDKAKAALSAPARNCDMYLTQPEMSRAYEEYRNAAMKSYGNGLTGRVPTVKQKPMTYDEWLFAPAANEMQKMREAVNVRKSRKIAKNIRRLVDHIRKEKSLSENLAREAFDQIDDLAIEALIAPPRNCDVGTAEEQKERFEEFCDDEKGDRQHCRNCRLCNALDCELAWAQMPYEEGGANGIPQQTSKEQQSE